MPGPTPQPLEIRRLRGNPGKRSLPTHGAKPQALAKRAPRYLSKRAQAHWRAYHRLLSDAGRLTANDAASFAMLCDTMAEVEELSEVLKAEGRTMSVISGQGQAVDKPRPEVAMAETAGKRLLALCQQFGLTPASRDRVSSIQLDATDPLTEFLKHGKTNHAG